MYISQNGSVDYGKPVRIIDPFSIPFSYWSMPETIGNKFGPPSIILDIVGCGRASAEARPHKKSCSSIQELQVFGYELLFI